MQTDMELIAAAVAAGRVRRIPTGVSGIDPFTGLPAEPMLFSQRLASMSPIHERSTATPESNARLRDLYLQGVTYGDMAKKLGIDQKTAWQRCRRLGLYGRPIKRCRKRKTS